MISDFFMNNQFHITINSPIGWLKITSDQKCILSVSFTDDFQEPSDQQPAVLKKAVKQLNEYFEGKRKAFELKISPEGTEFQQKVWEQVKTVLFGETTSYLAIAIKTGSKNNTRAVGLANGKNPIPIIIPCHRIIGVNGKLTGYSGGIEKKRWLLQHELTNTKPLGLLF